MTKLYSAREIIRALERAGFVIVSQKGSHIKLRCFDPDPRTVIVPNHKQIAIGTFRSILRQANLTIEEFTNLL